MAITNSGMTLYTDNDTQQNWTGTDDLDTYNTSIQGTNSESWNVGKNTTETGTLTLSANMGTAKYFNFWMKSDLANYYTSISCELQSSTNNFVSFTCADSTDRDISGDFHPSVCQLSVGTATGTYAPASHTVTRIIVDNSSSGNIRAVINNWIDAMYYGTGRTINGTTASDKMFLESHIADTTTSDTYDGCSDLYKGGLSFQTDVTVATTTGNSYGEVVTWAYARNTDNTYTLTITGTADFKNTNLIASGGATIALDSTSATSFGMTGGGISNGGTIDFGSGQTISGTILNSCNRVKSNGATLSNVTIGSTTETTTGALELVSATDLNNVSNITFNSYTGKYALYIPASITGSITLTGFKGDASGTDIYWGGTSGTLTVNASGGTNLSTWASAGGTVSVQNSVTLTLTGLPDGIEVRIRLGSYTLYHVQDTSGGSISYGYNYTGDRKVKVSFSGAGIIQSKTIELTLGSSDQSVPVQFENDPSYAI